MAPKPDESVAGSEDEEMDTSKVDADSDEEGKEPEKKDFRCAACTKQLPRAQFTGSQLKRKVKKCIACVENTVRPDPKSQRCTKCDKLKKRSEFSPAQRMRAARAGRLCLDCEAPNLKCSGCGEKKSRDHYGQKQLLKTLGKWKCKTCTGKEQHKIAPETKLLCFVCNVEKPARKFSKRQRRDLHSKAKSTRNAPRKRKCGTCVKKHNKQLLAGKKRKREEEKTVTKDVEMDGPPLKKKRKGASGKKVSVDSSNSMAVDDVSMNGDSTAKKKKKKKKSKKGPDRKRKAKKKKSKKKTPVLVSG